MRLPFIEGTDPVTKHKVRLPTLTRCKQKQLGQDNKLKYPTVKEWHFLSF